MPRVHGVNFKRKGTASKREYTHNQQPPPKDAFVDDEEGEATDVEEDPPRKSVVAKKPNVIKRTFKSRHRKKQKAIHPEQQEAATVHTVSEGDRKRSALDDDKLGESPTKKQRQQKETTFNAAGAISGISPPTALENLLKAKARVTRDDFLMAQPLEQHHERSLEMPSKFRQGELNRELSWQQGIPIGREFVLVAVNSSGNAAALKWEAQLLDWLHRQDPNSHLKPVALAVAHDDNVGTNTTHLAVEASENTAIFASLQDFFNFQCQAGSIPESVVAWLVVEMMRAVKQLHQQGVAHNDLGLDSFLLAWKAESSKWTLIVCGLDAKASVYGNHSATSCEHWHFFHDLYSITKLVWTLLTGGAPFSWLQKGNEGLELEHKDFISMNAFLRGGTEWLDLMQALLNPPSPNAGFHTNRDDWGLTAILSKLQTLASSGLPEQSPKAVFDRFSVWMDFLRNSKEPVEVDSGTQLVSTKLDSIPPHWKQATEEEEDKGEQASSVSEEIKKLKHLLAAEQDKNEQLQQAHKAELESKDVAHAEAIVRIDQTHVVELKELSSTNENLRAEARSVQADLRQLRDKLEEQTSARQDLQQTTDNLNREKRTMQRELRLWHQKDQQLRNKEVELQLQAARLGARGSHGRRSLP